MRSKLKLIAWLFVGATASAVAVPLIGALDATRPIALITENTTWIVLLVAGGVALITLLALRDAERAAGPRTSVASIDATLEIADPVSRVLLAAPWSADHRRYSLSFVCGVALALALLPIDVLSGDRIPERSPVGIARTVLATRTEVPGAPLSGLELVAQADGGTGGSGSTLTALMIDGDRDGVYVLFDHRGHQASYGDVDSCARCHHSNKGLDRATPCHECHADMVMETDVFSHTTHISELGGQGSCAGCHDGGRPKTRRTATACTHCHAGMRPASTDSSTTAAGVAPGYASALHASCIGCHNEEGIQEVDSHGMPLTCVPCHPASQLEQISSSPTWELLKAIRILAPQRSRATGETER